MIQFRWTNEWVWWVTDRHGYRNYQIFSFTYVPNEYGKGKALVLMCGPVRCAVIWARSS